MRAFVEDAAGEIRRHLEPERKDLLELDVGPSRVPGLLFYPRQPRPSAAMERLLRARAPDPAGLDLLRRFLAGVPAARQAVRIRADRALSLFFPIDLAPGDVATLATGVGAERLGRCAASALDAVGRSACGVAIEAVRDAPPRFRFYVMLVGGQPLEEWLRASEAHSGVDFVGDDGMGTWVRGVAQERSHLVASLGATVGREPSLKLEVPEVPLAALDPAPPFLDGLAHARALASELRLRRLAYLGLRRYRDGERQVTYYLDVRDRWVGAPAPSVPDVEAACIVQGQ